MNTGVLTPLAGDKGNRHMSMFSQLLSGLTGGSSGVMQTLMSTLMTNQQGSGGLAELIQKLEQGGLGPAVQSWVGTGENQAVSPQQLHSALGEEQVQQIAGQAGMQPHDLLSMLAQNLPSIIDKMTPNGQVPREPAA